MTFVGVRIEDGWLLVGFKAATRQEFEQHQLVVAAVADMLWSQGAEPMDLSRDPAEGPAAGDFVEPGFDELIDKAYERKGQKKPDWLERQGLA